MKIFRFETDTMSANENQYSLWSVIYGQLKVFILISSMFFSLAAFSQKYTKQLERANTLFEDYSYVQAIQEYDKILKKHDVPEAKIKLAECYRLTRQMDEAERWYWSASEQNAVDSVYMYNYASVLKYNKKYDEAKTWYLKYEAYKQDGKGAKQAKFLDLIHFFVRDSSKVDIKNMAFNSEYADFSPTFFKEGMLFSSSRTKGKNAGGLDQWTGENFLDLYYIEKINVDSSGKSKLLPGFINSNFHEGPATFDAQKNTIFFTRNNVEKGIQKRSKDGVLKIQIYSATTADNRWDVVTPFTLNNPDYIYCHPSLSPDGSRIYFASDMPGGFGGLDIYYSEKSGDTWAQPVNLGQYVNTQWNDAFPYIHSTGTLYFASDGLPGLGGLDVYSVRFGGRDWMDVKNLGYPINTSQDDFGFILDSTNKSGYVSSNRDGGKGSDDIYSIFIKDSYFEEGVLLSIEGETLKLPEPENDFDMLEDTVSKNLPTESLQATPQTIAGLPVIPAEETAAVEEALALSLFKPDYSQEDELAMKLMKDDKQVAAHAKETEKQQQTEKLKAESQQTNVVDIPAERKAAPGAATQTAPTNTNELKAPDEWFAPSAATANSSKTAPAKTSATTKPNAAKPSASAKTTTPVKPSAAVQQQVVNMKDAKGRIMLEKAPATVKTKTVEGLAYRVQVGAYSKPLRKSPEQFFKMEGIDTYSMNDNISRYITAPVFTDIKAAEAHKKQVVLKGIKDAFIVPFYQGNRISPEEVLGLLDK